MESAKKWACARLHADFENMRAAVAWCVRSQSDVSERTDGTSRHPPAATVAGAIADVNTTELALRLASALSWFGLTGERLHDVSSLLEAALQLAGGTGAVRAKALWGAGTVAMFLGSYQVARARLTDSCELYRANGDLRGLALALREGCGAAYAQRDLAAAQLYGEESIALFRSLGSQGDLALALDNLGGTLAAQGNYAAARAAYEEEYAISLALGYKSTLGLAAMGLGWVASLQGDYVGSVVHLEQALALYRELEESWTLAQVLSLLGEVAQRNGDLLRTGRCYRESILLAQQMGDKAAVAHLLQQVGTLAYAHGHYEDAARLFAAAEAHHLSGGAMSYTLASPPERSHGIAKARTSLGEELFAACWAQGHSMTLSQSVKLAAAAAEQMPGVTAPDSKSLQAVQLPGYRDHLTAREREVLHLLVQGLTYAEIADKLVISPRTVNAHLTTIYGKLDVNSRREAVRSALEHRLLDTR